MVTVGTWVFVVGFAALSIECRLAAVVLFGIAVLLVAHG
jgi:hypothetical protein